MPRAVIAVVFNGEDCAAIGPGDDVGEYEAVAVVEDGGVVDGVEGGDERLVREGRGEGGRCGVGDEEEGGWGVGHVVGFGSLEGALVCQHVGYLEAREGCGGCTSRHKRGLL